VALSQAPRSSLGFLTELAGIRLAKFGGPAGLMRADFMELCDDYHGSSVRASGTTQPCRPTAVVRFMHMSKRSLKSNPWHI
jgi:hypothetical protein